MEQVEPRTPGEAAYNKWRSMQQHPIVEWSSLNPYTRVMWENVAATALAFERRQPTTMRPKTSLKEAKKTKA